MKRDWRAFNRRVFLLVICFLLVCMSACESESAAESFDAAGSGGTQISGIIAENNSVKELKIKINETDIAVNWEDNESTTALKELVSEEPLTVQMTMYGGFEQVGSLGTNLPRNDVQTITHAGDVVLYSGNQIVIFYGSNSWAYTKLGHVDLSVSEMTELLSNGDVTITIFGD